MPRYFFNIFHNESHRDLEGTELPDKHAAWEQGTKTAGEMLKDIDGRLKSDQEWRMEIEDEFRHRLFVIHVSAENR